MIVWLYLKNRLEYYLGSELRTVAANGGSYRIGKAFLNFYFFKRKDILIGFLFNLI